MRRQDTLRSSVACTHGSGARRYLGSRWWLLRGLVAHCVLFVGVVSGARELAPPPALGLARLLWLAKAVRCEPLILSSFASLVRLRHVQKQALCNVCNSLVQAQLLR